MESSPPVTLYWRPACPFCMYLQRAVKKAKVDVDLVNIWDDPGAAAVVRRFADGNETVPTLVVGHPDDDDAVGLVNPSIDQVVRLLEQRAPSRLGKRQRHHGDR